MRTKKLTFKPSPARRQQCGSSAKGKSEPIAVNQASAAERRVTGMVDEQRHRTSSRFSWNWTRDSAGFPHPPLPARTWEPGVAMLTA